MNQKIDFYPFPFTTTTRICNLTIKHIKSVWASQSRCSSCKQTRKILRVPSADLLLVNAGVSFIFNILRLGELVLCRKLVLDGKNLSFWYKILYSLHFHNRILERFEEKNSKQITWLNSGIWQIHICTFLLSLSTSIVSLSRLFYNNSQSKQSI